MKINKSNKNIIVNPEIGDEIHECLNNIFNLARCNECNVLLKWEDIIIEATPTIKMSELWQQWENKHSY